MRRINYYWPQEVSEETGETKRQKSDTTRTRISRVPTASLRVAVPSPPLGTAYHYQTTGPQHSYLVRTLGQTFLQRAPHSHPPLLPPLKHFRRRKEVPSPRVRTSFLGWGGKEQWKGGGGVCLWLLPRKAISTTRIWTSVSEALLRMKLRNSSGLLEG